MNKKGGKEYIVKHANVEFPAILKGNEAANRWTILKSFSEKRRGYILRMHAKGKKLLPTSCHHLKKYDLPAELNVLLTLESAYNANAVSKAGAVGYWQIMDEVAKEYGMKYVAQAEYGRKAKGVKGGKQKEAEERAKNQQG